MTGASPQSSPPLSAPEGLIDPAALAGIGDLELLARTVVDGFIHGLHRSRRTGMSLDFAEHRQYQPGDDLRHVDWRVFGRTDRHYIKQYDADSNVRVTFVLDASASMDFGTTGHTKFDYARWLTAALAWLSQRQGDRVGLVVAASELQEVVPPSSRHLPLLLHGLGRARARGGGDLIAMIERAGHLTGGRSGLVVVLSDCYVEPIELRRALGALRARGLDVIVFHLIDPGERDLPWTAPGNFEDAESGSRMPLRPDDLRSEYQRLFQAHRTTLASELARERIEYAAMETDRPLDAALREFLDRRLAGSRSR